MVFFRKHPRSARITTPSEWVSTTSPRLITPGKFYLINAPWGFATVWAIVKRWLDPVTVSKISILGSSYQSALLEQIPAENLPAKFGGKCQCPGGCELSDAGPWQDPKWLAPQNPTSEASSGTAMEATPVSDIASETSAAAKPVPAH